jgi:LmbE family N-acetylglucosaminyl deacetylase
MMKIVAVIAAHADDEVLGCGGAISKFVKQGFAVHVLLLADGETSRIDFDDHHQDESRKQRNKAAMVANEILGTKSLTMLDFPDNRMDGIVLLDVVKAVEAFVGEHRPNIVITHFSNDVNIDHQITHQAVVVACRPQPGNCVEELLFMEVASSTEWLPVTGQVVFAPNYWIDITNFIDIKMKALHAYQKELREFPHPRSIGGVTAQATWRGVTVGVAFAEAFVAGRIIVK